MLGTYRYFSEKTIHCTLIFMYSNKNITNPKTEDKCVNFLNFQLRHVKNVKQINIDAKVYISHKIYTIVTS